METSNHYTNDTQNSMVGDQAYPIILLKIKGSYKPTREYKTTFRSSPLQPMHFAPPKPPSIVNDYWSPLFRGPSSDRPPWLIPRDNLTNIYSCIVFSLSLIFLLTYYVILLLLIIPNLQNTNLQHIGKVNK